ncbi:MAG TPA: GNAT family N-acetyltransferase [Alcanivorax sp.]|nr:GNAT family N-acetyltransferase [Alcanivorax sp.]MBT74899.1 GNAT family N-acetyltransferase [Alcanivorax sp.]HAD46236.1 GNAT family N-acetyltransferase [Alcanivorax sp.]HAI35966.1 GNAT family N-acetyltransferase [Alcanivorax sp.]HBP68355.1 GNAT family N-acetyltransferase [Alcanivorax sp.]|tara:strand:- start:1263 stop:1880 length:618 start_codon:yes stop_codon:yes gene_type:complete
MLKRLRRWLFGGPPTPGTTFAPERPADAPPGERGPAPAVNAEPPPDSLPSGLPFEIRPYRDSDAAALARVFREAILVTAADHYDGDQRRAWSAAADDPAFPADLAKGLTMVAEWQQETAGFAQLVDDRITLIYVHPDTARLGIATLLYQHLEDEARIQGRERLVTEASQVAHDFFLFLGFQPDAEETVERDGVTLSRWRMHKPLI